MVSPPSAAPTMHNLLKTVHKVKKKNARSHHQLSILRCRLHVSSGENDHEKCSDVTRQVFQSQSFCPPHLRNILRRLVPDEGITQLQAFPRIDPPCFRITRQCVLEGSCDSHRSSSFACCFFIDPWVVYRVWQPVCTILVPKVHHESTSPRRHSPSCRVVAT